MAHSLAGFFRLGILARLANQGAQLLRVGVRMLGDPFAKCIFFGNQAVAPDFGLVERVVFAG